MRQAVSILLVCAFGCATTPKPQVEAVVKESRRPEDRPLPEDPADAELPVDRGEDFPPVALDRGQCVAEGETEASEGAEGPCPAHDGILISERTAWKTRLYQIRYNELRRYYLADRQVWAVHRELYEEKLKLSQQALQKAHDEAVPSFWEENDGTIGLISGLILGGVISIGIAAGLDEAQK